MLPDRQDSGLFFRIPCLQMLASYRLTTREREEEDVSLSASYFLGEHRLWRGWLCFLRGGQGPHNRAKEQRLLLAVFLASPSGTATTGFVCACGVACTVRRSAVIGCSTLQPGTQKSAGSSRRVSARRAWSWAPLEIGHCRNHGQAGSIEQHRQLPIVPLRLSHTVQDPSIRIGE